MFTTNFMKVITLKGKLKVKLKKKSALVKQRYAKQRILYLYKKILPGSPKPKPQHCWAVIALRGKFYITKNFRNCLYAPPTK